MQVCQGRGAAGQSEIAGLPRALQDSNTAPRMQVQVTMLKPSSSLQLIMSCMEQPNDVHPLAAPQGLLQKLQKA